MYPSWNRLIIKECLLEGMLWDEAFCLLFNVRIKKWKKLIIDANTISIAK